MEHEDAQAVSDGREADIVGLDEVLSDASLFSSQYPTDLVGLEDACNKRKFKQQNKNGETCSFCEHCSEHCELGTNSKDNLLKHDGKEKNKISFNKKIWEGFTLPETSEPG